MIRHSDIGSFDLITKIKEGAIQFGGYLPGRIYGRLDCKSGKRMKRENRVFFSSEEDAVRAGFRPCGNCMRSQYLAWKAGWTWWPA